MIWLVAFSLSPTHGSEAAVGWQWYERLRRRGATTVIAHRMFDTLGWVPEPLRSDVRWIDTAPAAVADVNRRSHLFRFWRQARALLRAEVMPDDVVVIATQATIWFLPWLGLPIGRDRVFYGPIGPELLRTDPAMTVRMRAAVAARNVATRTSATLWRLGAAWLPASIALRFPAPWVASAIGPRFAVRAVLPEVEPPAATGAHLAAASPGSMAVLYDPRARKNFAGSLAYAMTCAATDGVPVTVVGAPLAMESAIAARAGTVRIVFRPRSERAEFRSWLAAEQPTLVALSLSEGVPSTLYEALISGCTLHVLEVGGVTWLIRFAAVHERRHLGRRAVSVIGWNDASAARYGDFTRAAYDDLLNAIIPARAIDTPAAVQ